jgi:hypothetical protein
MNKEHTSQIVFRRVVATDGVHQVESGKSAREVRVSDSWSVIWECLRGEEEEIGNAD